MDEKYNVNGQGPAANGPAAPAQPPRKVRRVGTFTFGLLLVVAGVMLILRTVMPSLDLRFVVNLLPVALIALGIEVLIYAARPNVQLKYDGLSIFVCILILMGVGGSSPPCSCGMNTVLPPRRLQCAWEMNWRRMLPRPCGTFPN